MLSKQTGTSPINPPPPKANLSTHPDKLGCYPNKRVHLPLTLPHPRPTCPPRQAGVLSKQTGTSPINPPPPKANLSTHPDKLGCYPNKRVHLPLTLPHPRPTCPPTQTSWSVGQTNSLLMFSRSQCNPIWVSQVSDIAEEASPDCQVTDRLQSTGS